MMVALSPSLSAVASSSSCTGCCGTAMCSANSLAFSQPSVSSSSAALNSSFRSNVDALRGKNAGRRRYVCSVAVVSRTYVEEESIVSSPPEKKDKKNSTMRQLILKPPLSDNKLADRFLQSPQLRLRSFPLLSSCLPVQNLKKEDEEWMDEFLLEAKDALGYDLDVLEPQQDAPASHLDSLLFLAFNHKLTPRGGTKWVGIGHSRLSFLGQFVIELALCELFLQMYPRERVGPLRERVFNLTSRLVLPYWFKQASLERLVFPTEELEALKTNEKQRAIRNVFWALVAATYLTLGMPEVYRLLFEVFGMDLDAPTAQPRERSGLPDEDFLSPDLETKKTWQEIVSYAPHDSLFSSPLLFRACVPPGMHRFRGNRWEFMNLSAVREALGYPLQVMDSSPEITEARNVELDLGLQDVVGAEQLLMKHLDSPASWLETKHRLQFMNRICGRTLREKKLQRHIIYADERQEQYDSNRRLRNFATTSVSHAIHGVGYLVYGRSEVRRLINKVFPVNELISRKFL